jgi:preprotein translocase subunit SecE
MLSGAVYKRNQGRVVRQATFFAVVAVVAIGCFTLSNTVMSSYGAPIRTGIPVAIGALGAWFAWRLINYPKFADFLIAVEGEMDKVSWPEWPYLWRAAGVVVSVLVLFMAYMWLCDTVWVWLFNLIGFLNLEALG